MAEGGLIPPVILEIKARAGELFTELGKVRSEVKSTADETEKHGSTMGSAMQGAGKAIAIGFAGAAVTVAGFAIEAATSAEVVEAKLSTAIKNAGGNIEELQPKIAATDSRLRTFGFTNDQTNTALATLTTALKDPEKALGAMSVAADLAKAKNIDLNQASLLVAKAMEGQTRPLKQLGIDLPVYNGSAQNVALAQQALAKAQQKANDILTKTPDAANASSKAHAAYEKALAGVDAAHKKLDATQDSGKQIMDALSQRVHGAASAYGDTLAGKVAAAKAGLEAMGESLGQKLIPVITAVVDKGLALGKWLGDHKEVLIIFGGVVAAVVAPAFVAWAIAAGTAAAATVAASWPLMLIVLAVAAVGAAIYELVTHWTQVWGAIKDAAAAVWDWLKGAWSWISDTFMGGMKAGIGFVKDAWNGAWDGIKNAVSGVWDFLKGAWDWIVHTFLGFMKTEVQGFKNIWNGAWDGIKTAVSTVWDWLKGAYDWFVDRFFGGLKAWAGIFRDAWNGIWGAVKNAVSDTWNGLKTIWGWIEDGIGGVKSVISELGKVWGDIWDGIGSALRWVYDHTIGPIVNTIKGAIGGIKDLVGGIGSVASSVGHFLGFANGGPVPGAPGQPRLAVVHGGEYVLSQDMLSGRQAPAGLGDAQNANGYQPAASMSQQALTGSQPASAGATATTAAGAGVVNNINVTAQTNASSTRIAKDIGWVLQGMMA